MDDLSDAEVLAEVKYYEELLASHKAKQMSQGTSQQPAVVGGKLEQAATSGVSSGSDLNSSKRNTGQKLVTSTKLVNDSSIQKEVAGSSHFSNFHKYNLPSTSQDYSNHNSVNQETPLKKYQVCYPSDSKAKISSRFKLVKPVPNAANGKGLTLKKETGNILLKNVLQSHGNMHKISNVSQIPATRVKPESIAGSSYHQHASGKRSFSSDSLGVAMNVRNEKGKLHKTIISNDGKRLVAPENLQAFKIPKAQRSVTSVRKSPILKTVKSTRFKLVKARPKANTTEAYKTPKAQKPVVTPLMRKSPFLKTVKSTRFKLVKKAIATVANSKATPQKSSSAITVTEMSRYKLVKKPLSAGSEKGKGYDSNFRTKSPMLAVKKSSRFKIVKKTFTRPRTKPQYSSARSKAGFFPPLNVQAGYGPHCTYRNVFKFNRTPKLSHGRSFPAIRKFHKEKLENKHSVHKVDHRVFPARRTITRRSGSGKFLLSRNKKSLRRISLGTPNKPAAAQLVARQVISRSRFHIQCKQESKAAERKKACLYYNRFGRCSRGEKCPFVHDPKNIALCTRFLRGTCKVKNCPFSHNIVKEKMPVCSYFLKGLCKREACPYLHVNVGNDAEVCSDFLEGFCKAGDKCRKKHISDCPEFATTGTCSLGKRCQLKHKKYNSKITRKRKSETTTSSRVSGVEKSSVQEEAANDEDTELPFKHRRLPSYIALPKSSPTTPADKYQGLSTKTEKKIQIRPNL